MPGSTAISTNWAPPGPSSPSNSSRAGKRRRDDDDIDSDSAAAAADPRVIDLTKDFSSQPHANHQLSRKQRRVGPSTSSIPHTLPTQPHEELLAELGGRYDILTASVISSSKINKKVTSVLAHLGHVDLYNPENKPGVMMLHARAGDAGKMVTVMELAKRRMGEEGVAWYQYNRVYEVAGEANTRGRGGPSSRRAARGANQTIIEDTVMDGAERDDDGEEEDEEEQEAFEPIQTALDVAIRDKPATEPKTTYMSIFLSRVPIPELQAKTSITLQTNANEVGSGKA
ncbi:hypothetical protein M406DRAFT_47181 [Cryphonectria parasitica EP155]|uniref:DNA/RNA-binding protein Alba-like domain-containing protein n=1 Tax=Cryphonectria parasitica (strain ATCC 38755 / EP155) TaxID=660469 RepID=A0A9P4XUF1_CRYP1|nr:uncharacterized protein M406DRAFT_47181 [Cryphonectria parasitica EP155]KAF3760860.1 hypothetical protein M406DRAFT_47181 [Cryphonectria parasitica EP155]